MSMTVNDFTNLCCELIEKSDFPIGNEFTVETDQEFLDSMYLDLWGKNEDGSYTIAGNKVNFIVNG